MRKAFIFFVFSAFLSVSFAQNVSVINGEPINNKEFMWFYKKNHNGIATGSYKDLLKYLEQHINFKLKVLDAKELGLDKKASYKEELKDYEIALRARNKDAYSKKDYEYLLNEFRDGVLMFNVSEQKIWIKAQDDDLGLQKFYSLNLVSYNQPLNEIRAQVIADYQQSLEDEWLKNLREKYKIKINQKELQKLAKPL